MRYSEFETEMLRLKITYGEKTFPKERQAMFWKRYEHFEAKKFSEAVDVVILKMTPLSQIVDVLDDFTKTPWNAKARDDQKVDFPVNPLAKEMAEYYVPLIKEEMKKIGKKLPYDKTKRTG